MNAQTGEAILSGLGECFGLDDARISWKRDGEKQELMLEQGGNHHEKAVGIIVDLVESMNVGEQLVAIGHRVVHGGEKFANATLLNDDVITEIEALSDLAPLHNPANVMASAQHEGVPKPATSGCVRHRFPPDHASKSLYRCNFKRAVH